MTTFTKEQLQEQISEAQRYPQLMTDLAAFALAQMERIEMLRAERDVANGTACAEEQADGKGPCGVCRNCARAERDEARRELAEAEEFILWAIEPNLEKWVSTDRILGVQRSEVEKITDYVEKHPAVRRAQERSPRS